MRAKRASPLQELEFTGPEGPEILVFSYFVCLFTFFLEYYSSTYFKECVLRAKRASPPQELEFTGPKGPEILVS